MTQPAEIRTLNVDDAEALMTLRRRALQEEPLSFMATPENDVSASLERVGRLLDGEAGSVVLGGFGRDLLGMVGLRRDAHRKSAHKAYIWGLYVRPESRRQGLGRRLLEAAIEQARHLDGARLLHLSVADPATGAKQLYLKAGFETWGREPESLCHEGRCVAEDHMVLRLP